MGPYADPSSGETLFSYNGFLEQDGVFKGVIQVEVLPVYFVKAFSELSPFQSNMVTVFNDQGGILFHQDPDSLLWSSNSSSRVQDYSQQLGIDSSLNTFFFNKTAPVSRKIILGGLKYVQFKTVIFQRPAVNSSQGMDLVLLQSIVH